MSENIWLCAIYGKADRFQELASAGITIQPTGDISINAMLLVELLFGDAYAAFAERATRSDRLSLMLERDDITRAETFDNWAQTFLNAAYSAVINRGETPKISPDFYAIRAPASANTLGSPIYFFALGTGLNLPREARRGKVPLPSR
jgi:hypothetical protein